MAELKCIAVPSHEMMQPWDRVPMPTVSDNYIRTWFKQLAEKSTQLQVLLLRQIGAVVVRVDWSPGGLTPQTLGMYCLPLAVCGHDSTGAFEVMNADVLRRCLPAHPWPEGQVHLILRGRQRVQ